MQLTMSTRSLEGVLIVDCSGRLVFGEESARVRDTVKQLLAQSPKVVMNLREVNYIDSSGVASLVEGLKASRDVGSRLILFGLSPIAREVLQLSRLLTIFEIYDTEEQALGA